MDIIKQETEIVKGNTLRVAASGIYDAFLVFYLTLETWGEFVFNYFWHRVDTSPLFS